MRWNVQGFSAPVTKAAELLSELEEHQFLGDFSKEANPTQFLNRYQKLEKPQAQLLYEIMEKEKGGILLQKAGGAEGEIIRSKLKLHIDGSPYGEEESLPLKTRFSFKQGFEERGMSIRPTGNGESIMTPVAYFPNAGEFAITFRSFYSDDPPPKNSICFNGENLIIPNYESVGISQEADRSDYFSSGSSLKCKRS